MRSGPSKPRQRPTLPQGCPCSTIGPGELNFRVRDGNGCDLSGVATRKKIDEVRSSAGMVSSDQRPRSGEREIVLLTRHETTTSCCMGGKWGDGFDLLPARLQTQAWWPAWRRLRSSRSR